MANTTWSTTDLLSTTLSGGNLVATGSAAGGGVRSADKQVTGQFYWETTLTTWGNTSTTVGIARLGTAFGVVAAALTNACVVNKSGAIFLNGATLSASLGALSAGSVICHALDCTNKLYWVRSGAAGNWNGSATANPATGVGGIDISALLANNTAIYALASFSANLDKVTANFGDGAFTGTAPSGFTGGFTAGASVTTYLQASGAVRETLLSTTGRLYVAGMVREVLRSGAGGAFPVATASPQVCVIT